MYIIKKTDITVLKSDLYIEDVGYELFHMAEHQEVHVHCWHHHPQYMLCILEDVLLLIDKKFSQHLKDSIYW